MKTKNIILKLRTERGMSQDELADKIMVTRQAVSRWENGDTVPNTDTLKLLSKEFDISINTLLGEPRKLICQCCGMPIDDDSILGRDKDGTKLIAVMDLIMDYPKKNTAFIGLFMMDVNYQNKGIGSKVIGEVSSYLKSENYEKIRLGVDKGNPQSYSFWNKNGFVTVGENQYIIMEQIIM